MDVILHFGAHRTASTTLQRVLGQNGPRLRDLGLAYWGPKRTRSDLFRGLLARTGPLAPWAARRPARTEGRIRLALSELEQAGTRTLLISEENMLGGMRSALDQGLLYPDVGARLSRLVPVFAQSCIRIGLTIRSYDAWWTSALAFSLPRGGPLPLPEVARGLALQPRRWRHVIEELAAAFPKAEIQVCTYEVMGARPEQVCAALFAEDMPALAAIRDWHNAAPTPAVMRQHLADLGVCPDVLREASGRFMLFTGAERRALQAAYVEDLAWLRDADHPRITYFDDLDTDPIATGRGRGRGYDGEYRQMA